MNNNLVIRRYEDKDETRVNEFFTAYFDGWKGWDYWQWKYKDNPAGFFGNIWLAEEGDTIASCWGIIPIMVKVNDEVIMGAQSVEAATHPDYRRRGLFVTLIQKTLAESVKDGINLTFVFPGRKSYGGFMKSGCHDLGSVPRRYRVLNIAKALGLRAAPGSLAKFSPHSIFNTVKLAWKTLRNQKLSYEEVSPLTTVRYILLLGAAMLSNPRCLFRSGDAGPVPGLAIKEVDSFDERVTYFWREISSGFPVAVDRNCEYLNWRYKLNPVSKFVLFVAENEGRIDGYMVLKSETDEGIIMDIMSRDNRIFTCLLHKALRYFADEGKAVVECWMPDNLAYSKILRKYGFGSYQWVEKFASRFRFWKGLTNPFVISVNSINGKGVKPEIERLDSWFLAAGDSDWEEMSLSAQ